MRGVEDCAVRLDGDELRSSRCSSCGTELMRALRSHTRHLATLARAITQIGRAAKTVHLLDYCNDPRYRRGILGQLNRGESRHDLARQVRAALAAAQPLGARRSASRAGRPALGRHVTRDQPAGGARCVLASKPSRLLSRPVHSLHRQAERATVPGDAFESSSPSYVLFSALSCDGRSTRRPGHTWMSCRDARGCPQSRHARFAPPGGHCPSAVQTLGPRPMR